MSYSITKHMRGNVTATVYHDVPLWSSMARAVLSATDAAEKPGAKYHQAYYIVTETRAEVLHRCTTLTAVSKIRIIDEPEDPYGRLALCGASFVPELGASVYVGCIIEKITCTVIVMTTSPAVHMHLDAVDVYAPRDGASWLQIVSEVAALLDNHPMHWTIGDTFEGAGAWAVHMARTTGKEYMEPLGSVTTVLASCKCAACWRIRDIKKEHAPGQGAGVAVARWGLDVLAYVVLSMAIGLYVSEVLR